MDTPSVQAITGFTSASQWCSLYGCQHKPTAVSRVLSNDVGVGSSFELGTFYTRNADPGGK